MTRPQLAIGAVLALLLGLLFALQVWILRGAGVAVDCLQAGVVDQINLDLEGMEAHFEGWAITPAFAGEYAAVQAGRELDVGPRSARRDVAQHFAGCPAALQSGFSLRAPLAQIDVGAGPIIVRPRTAKAVALQFDPARLPPFGALDPIDGIAYDRRNVVSGWVIAPGGTAKVKLYAGDQLVAERLADGARAEVQKTFRGWPGAARSGFEFMLAMEDLPRGRYRLRVILENARGERTELPGPQVEHDEAWGRLVSAAPVYANPTQLELAAWVDAPHAIARVDVIDEAHRALAHMHLRARDIPYMAPGDPRAARHSARPGGKGMFYRVRVRTSVLAAGVHRLRGRVVDAAGRVSELAGPLVVMGETQARDCPGEALRVFLPGGTTLFRADFPDLKNLRSVAAGGCVEIGLRGRVEYLRTTRGKTEDFIFDPAFPERKRVVAGREMVGDSLRTLLATALRLHAPLLVTLDGGVWADARFPAPEFDVVDNLEDDERLVQWNQWNKSEPDDALKGMSSSFDDPQLARMLTLNRYNARFRYYKKRNLQAAVRALVRFMHAHPEIYVAINLDPDNYINPWFTNVQWYDYNPDTVRQFREWLLHLGPYADGGELAGERYGKRLTLSDVNRIAGHSWQKSEDIDPPREKIDYTEAWQQIWTHFKRHLVAQHYADLAAWAHEAGMPDERIYTAVGMNDADIAVTLDDAARGWMDQAGVSIAGGKPSHGHIGAILYGATSRNEGIPRSGLSLLDNVRALDPQWGAIEFHPASLVFRQRLPSEAESYRTLLAILNGGAHLISPMRGSAAGERELFPQDFRAYDVMEGSSFEYELVWWLREWRRRPAGSLYFPFGNALVASDDGWSADAGSTLVAAPGHLMLRAKNGEARLVSPRWAGISAASAARLRIDGDWAGASLRASLCFDDGSVWQATHVRAGAGLAVPAQGDKRMVQIALTWSGVADRPIVLDSVAWTPRARSAQHGR